MVDHVWALDTLSGKVEAMSVADYNAEANCTAGRTEELDKQLEAAMRSEGTVSAWRRSHKALPT